MPWVGNAIAARLRCRMRQVERVRRQHTVRNRRTWTASCQANLMKLRYRHANPYQTNPYLHGWDLVVSHQIEKYALRLDPVNAWQKREFRILEKMHIGEFRQDQGLVHGSTWSFAANMQGSKVNRLGLRPRRKPARRYRWLLVLKRLTSRESRLSEKEITNSWHVTVLGAIRNLGQTQEESRWNDLVYHSWRRIVPIAKDGLPLPAGTPNLLGASMQSES